MGDRWDEFFLRMCLESARMSKDPSTKVGAVIVNKHHGIVSTGFNGFPIGIADTMTRWYNRDTKLNLVVHAEMNAVLFAARSGHSTNGCTIYVAATDGSKEIWGGPPCVRCTVECMQAGIVEYVSRPVKIAPSRWHESIKAATMLLQEAGLKYREVA